MARRVSRPDRWLAAAEEAKRALQELVDIQGEYQEWRDNIPENMESSPTAEKLDEVTELDLETALSTVEDAEGLDLPRGFGRD